MSNCPSSCTAGTQFHLYHHDKASFHHSWRTQPMQIDLRMFFHNPYDIHLPLPIDFTCTASITWSRLWTWASRILDITVSNVELRPKLKSATLFSFLERTKFAQRQKNSVVSIASEWQLLTSSPAGDGLPLALVNRSLQHCVDEHRIFQASPKSHRMSCNGE